MSAAARLERVRERTPAVEAEVARVMRECGDYYGAIHGRDADASDLEDFFATAVPGIAPEDIHAYLLREGPSIVGCAGLILGWKRPGQSMIGLLLVARQARGRGVGRAAALQLEDVARASPHGHSMRIGVVETNAPAFGFWHGLGYEETGERPVRPGYRGPIVILEKALDAA